MKILTLILCTIVLIATGLPLINSAEWWIRIFDFPRLQIAVLILLAMILAYAYLNFKRAYKLPLLLILAVSLVYQLKFVVVYTPLYKTQAKDSNKQRADNSFTLLVINVFMENEDKESFHELVKRVKPDVLLINEPDQVWAESISKLDGDFPYSVKYPLDNTYGMILLSKLQLTESVVNFLVKDSIPSIFTKITLPSGSKFDFYGVHPEPPKPGTDTYERDTELLLIGKEIKKSNNPTVVAGDLNDVGWSDTSKLFRKYSELVDPREGRGLYNSFSAFVPLLRYPLDHIFYSKEFGLISIEKLESIGSDHFPIFIGLNYEPDEDNTDGLEKTDPDEEEEVEEKIGEGKNEGNKD
ncbi:endonuclease/exonuclease/phosphatase family protein [Algoriphagus sp. D3-2-R+10]|uniref:endonuclease/exonuclease/phosphatase family protein n=1 Tax=Algoriphagus aurantiacus TaxID=3103948 RepID=UPI002B3B2694|nr:endonuclease/exonuclease/phosphatase family protein [Algoriphagus sp. D3-2-R+10]MEB2778636.1 endonuclease/exonuclease/phosphatase family protein [Algoriphagus sp. D3-2-R+10]